MFRVDIEKLVPKFLLADKNGYALAKAIETGLQKMNDVIAQGVDCINNYDTMPEWRLDELAWETNCLYDYNAGIETKRKWISEAEPLYRIYGTPEAILQYIGSYFDSIDLEENWIYNGKPYHFRVTVEGDWTPANESWTNKAVKTAKNTRSVLDAIHIGCKCYIGIEAEGEVLARFRYPMTSEGLMTGTWPQDAMKGVMDESGVLGMDAQISGYDFSYPLTGTIPEINTLGVSDELSIGLEAEITDQFFGYPMTSEELKTGTVPHDNMTGVVDDVEAGIVAEADSYRFPYPLTGTIPKINTEGIVEEKSAAQGTEADGISYRIIYKMCGEDTF